MTHPRQRLDEVIHVPVRLSVMALLMPRDKVEFRFLRDALEVSDTLLSKHLGVLERKGYVEIVKGSSDRRPRTWVRASGSGRAAFASYLETLGTIVGYPLTPDAYTDEGP